MPILSPRPPSPRHRGVCVQRSQPPGKDTACAWLSQRGFGRRGWGDPWTAERVPRNGYGSHGNPGLLSQRSRSVLRERWLRCSDTVRGFRPGHVPLWVPDITARFRWSGTVLRQVWLGDFGKRSPKLGAYLSKTNKRLLPEGIKVLRLTTEPNGLKDRAVPGSPVEGFVHKLMPLT